MRGQGNKEIEQDLGHNSSETHTEDPNRWKYSYAIRYPIDLLFAIFEAIAVGRATLIISPVSAEEKRPGWKASYAASVVVDLRDSLLLADYPRPQLR